MALSPVLLLCFLLARAPRSTYPLGTGSSLLRAAIVCLSQIDKLPKFYFLQINEEFPSHGAQPSLTYAPWDRLLPAWPLQGREPKGTSASFLLRARVPPQYAASAQHVPWISQPVQFPLGNSHSSPPTGFLSRDGVGVSDCVIGATEMSTWLNELPYVTSQFGGPISFTFCYSTWTLLRSFLRERQK
jgi:hypothetical protein